MPSAGRSAPRSPHRETMDRLAVARGDKSKSSNAARAYPVRRALPPRPGATNWSRLCSGVSRVREGAGVTDDVPILTRFFRRNIVDTLYRQHSVRAHSRENAGANLRFDLAGQRRTDQL